AGLIAGRRTKWAVLALWIVLLVALGPLMGRLGDVEENDAASWLPEGAESTQVVELEEQFRTDETALAVVIYERAGGITAEDRATPPEHSGAARQLHAARHGDRPHPARRRCRHGRPRPPPGGHRARWGHPQGRRALPRSPARGRHHPLAHAPRRRDDRRRP